jgi:hypothetical protein
VILAQRGPGNPPHPPGGPPPPGQAQVAPPEELLVQDGEVTQGNFQFNGIVFYPRPFAFTPHVTLRAGKGGGDFRVAKQDEFSFNWESQAAPGGLTFTWEAKGVRLDGKAAAMRETKQEGVFQAVPGESGEVRFPTPFALPPNVELSGAGWGLDHTTIVECKATGFKWKHNDKTTQSTSLTWRAKGVKATAAPKE